MKAVKIKLHFFIVEIYPYGSCMCLVELDKNIKWNNNCCK